MNLAVIATYKVLGMTCSHCVAAVTSELMAVPGVSNVDVNLETGDVVVTATRDINRETVNSAIDEAGYELAE